MAPCVIEHIKELRDTVHRRFENDEKMGKNGINGGACEFALR